MKKALEVYILERPELGRLRNKAMGIFQCLILF